MTEYDDGSGGAMHDRDDDHHHHGGARHLSHYFDHKWVSPHYGKLACIIGVSLIALFALIFGIYFGLAGEFHGHVHTHAMDMETLKARANPFESHALYAASSGARKSEYRANFCHAGLYHVVWSGGGKSHNGTAALLAAPTDELSQLMALRPYVLSAKVALRYNVERANAFPGGSGGTTTTSAGRDDRYVVTRFQLASSYLGFSTIRLVESAVDIYRRQVRTVRALTLCSDDPISSAGRCKQYATLDGDMIINNTYTAPMDQPTKKPPANGTGFGTSGHGADQDVDVQHDRADRHAMEEDIAHIRLYHLLFYSEHHKQGPGGGAPRDADNSDDDADYNGDYQVLSMQVTPC
jgi:hypothetical protein